MNYSHIARTVRRRSTDAERLTGRGMTLSKMMRCCIILICGFLTVVLPAHAWQLPVEIATYNDNGDKIYNKLVAGVEPGATEGFDNLWDTPALVSYPDPDKPVFLRSFINGPVDGEFQSLWKDIRGQIRKGSTTWDITVDSVPAGKAVIIRWDLPVGALKSGERLVLKDIGQVGVEGQPVVTDIVRTSSYVFLYDSEGPRTLSLIYSKESTDSPKSDGGSGFGCGTVKSPGDEPPAAGSAAIGMMLLFSPLVFLKLLRNRG